MLESMVVSVADVETYSKLALCSLIHSRFGSMGDLYHLVYFAMYNSLKQPVILRFRLPLKQVTRENTHPKEYLNSC